MALKRASDRIKRRIDPALMLPLAAAAVLAYLAAVPVGMLILSSFQKGLVEVELTLDNYVAAYANPDTYSTLVNSLVFGLSSAVATFVVATVLAWLVERTDTPFRRVFMVVAVAPLILPGVLEAIAWVFLLAPRSGYINVAFRDLFGLSADPFNIFTLPGMIWVQSIGQVPLAMLLMIAAFRSMDPSLEESAAMSGANTFQILRRITMRLIVPVSASVLLLLFVRTIEGFEVAAIMGLPGKVYVYTSEIYQAYRRFPPNYGLASALGVGLTLLTCVGLFLYIRATRYGERFQTVTGKAFRPKRFELGRWRWVSAAFLVGYLAIAVIMPFLVVAWQSLMPYYVPPSLEALSMASVDAYAALPENKRFLTALFNSLTLSILAATITVLLTSIVAWIVYRTKLRGRRFLDFLAFLPITVPGIVLGMGLIVFYVSFPIGIYGTLWLMLIAYITKFLPYGMRSASGSIVQIHRDLEEAASMSGASWWQVFRRVTLPLLRPGLAAGWIYIAIVAFREFGTSVMLATPQTQVLSILIYNMYDQGETAEVAAIGIVMVVTILMVVLLFNRVTGRSGIQV